MFYTFVQNNSGGGFSVNVPAGISHYVIVEARDAVTANMLAQDLGIYFNGVSKGYDCDCCGDRWYVAYDSDGTELPEIYDSHPSEVPSMWTKAGEGCCVHYLDGRMEWF